MTSWFNPRVAAVAISIIVLVQVSKVGEPRQTIRTDVISCGLLYLLYVVVFLIPIARSLGIRRLLGPATTLTLAWIAVAAALVADAIPFPLSVTMQRHLNWPMASFCVAGAIAFFLFFQSVVRSFELREDVLQARGGGGRQDD